MPTAAWCLPQESNPSQGGWFWTTSTWNLSTWCSSHHTGSFMQHLDHNNVEIVKFTHYITASISYQDTCVALKGCLPFFFFKPTVVMAAAEPSELEMDTTIKAHRCNLTTPPQQALLPRAPLPRVSEPQATARQLSLTLLLSSKASTHAPSF